MNMFLFLTIFFLLYGGIHLYVFLKAKAAFAFGTSAGISLILFMLTMVFAPLIVWFTEKLELEIPARLMSYIGYTWMGVISLFFSLSLCIDIYRLCVHLIGSLFSKDLSAIVSPARISFYIALLLSISIAVYGYFEALNIRPEKVTIKTSKIPKKIGRLRIVQISDVHLGLTIRARRLQRILEEVRRAEPDILVSTGDLVDGQSRGIMAFSSLFNDINPKYGKFAVTGNHEFYAGIGYSLKFTEKAGFRILRNEGITIADIINIVGIDDPTGKEYTLYNDISERKLLSQMPRDKFTLLLKHRPVVDKDSSGLFDLQLSGHTHKGQIFPFSLLTWLYYRHTIHAGHLRLVNNSYLYVSRGAGTWGPPMRFLSPPEITVIELVHDSGGKNKLGRR